VLQKPDSRFLSITAHDLRGAVGVLDGATKELTRELSKDNADAAKLTQMVARSTQRLLLLGDRLSVLAKLMDGPELELSEPADLTALVKEATNRAFSAHARRNLTLRVEGPPASAAMHGQALSGAVSELTALFCSFSQVELVVTVTTTAKGLRVTFQSDNASESVQRALRDRSAATQANAGVSFAEDVIVRHRGSLEISENNGSNAAISLVLPLARG
jgi:signal transduction histidine kinase